MPSVANTQRIIVGKIVEPSNEVKAVRPMIEQSERIGGPVAQGMFDAASHVDEVIALSVEKNTDLLSP